MSHDDLAGRSGRVLFLGAVHEALPALTAVIDSPDAELVGVVTYDEDLSSRTAGFVDLARIVEPFGVPVLRTSNANAAASLAWVRALRPDLLVCVGWTRLLSPEMLSIPRRGAVGFHASLLPRNRGRAPVNWAILRGERVTGNTMMMLSPGVDDGDIIDQREIVIEPHDTCATLYDKVGTTGAAMLSRHLAALLDGTAPLRPQVHDPREPALPKRTPAMGITSFDRTSLEVHDWIRALTRPYAGAFAYLDGRKVTFWRAEPHPQPRQTASRERPGTVLGALDDGVLVSTRTGSVRLLEVQREGGPVEPAATWLAREGIRSGAAFESVSGHTLAWALGAGPHPDSLSASAFSSDLSPAGVPA